MKKGLLKVLIMATMACTLSINTMAFADKEGTSSNKDENYTQSQGQNQGQNQGNEGNTNLNTNNIQPKKLIISAVKVEPNFIEPGREFTLTYKIENITNSKLYGVSLKLAGVEGKGGLVGFTPVGTTNEIYAGSIAAGDVKEISIRLVSDSKLPVGTYNFLTSIMYNEYGKEQEEISKISGIQLKNSQELFMSDIRVNGDALGAPSIGTTLNNDGKGVMKKVNLVITYGEEKYTRYIGKIEGESEEEIEEVLNPVSVDTKGKVEVTYENESGEEKKISKDFELKAQDVENNSTTNKKEESRGFLAFIKRIFGIGE